MEKEDSNLLAILGPTNTGKTYLAFERLTSYKSGIIGFPLRLLARENYDKAILKLGIQNVALITGEEKIIPKTAKYFFCTIESMPLNIDVECVAIDEVQLAADYERGHIFTDRILNLRGKYETILLGSLTIEKILKNLFPKIDIQKRSRFSRLSFLQKKTLSKLNPRSAIIAFNINSVYEIAESLKTLKGGKVAKEVISILLTRSALNKRMGTYYLGLPKLILDMNWKHGIIYGQLNQCVARTGRLSSSKPNLQNFDGEIKTLFVSQYGEQ